MRSAAKHADERWLLRDKYGGRRTAMFEKDRARLAKGEPVDYVIGWKPFLGCRIDLSKKPLIPRPETEEWTVALITRLHVPRYPFSAPRSTIHILDLCAGSGCIGIALARDVPGAHVTFTDIRPECILQIKKNLRTNAIPKNRTCVIRSNLFTGVKGKFDIITANPPYIPRGRALPKSVAGYEPHRALFSGRDGLGHIRRILKNAPAHLARGGLLVMEYDSGEKRAIKALIKKSGAYAAHEWRRDQYGKWRTVWLKNKFLISKS